MPSNTGDVLCVFQPQLLGQSLSLPHMPGTIVQAHELLNVQVFWVSRLLVFLFAALIDELWCVGIPLGASDT